MLNLTGELRYLTINKNKRIRYPNTDEYHINLLLNNATHITKVNTCIHSTISILYKLPGTVF
jgi:hypothetical protein